VIDPYDDDPEPRGTALLLAKLSAVHAELRPWRSVPTAARAIVVELLEQKADPGELNTPEVNAAFRAAASVLRALSGPDQR
jgi:hypothetical protein